MPSVTGERRQIRVLRPNYRLSFTWPNFDSISGGFDGAPFSKQNVFTINDIQIDVLLMRSSVLVLRKTVLVMKIFRGIGIDP